MKHEWRKHEKEMYGVQTTPRIVNCESQSYITIKGKGNPNNKDFSEKVSALFALAYAIKMEYKAIMKTSSLDACTDFTVYPLEGIWEEKDSEQLIKEHLSYTIMIRQPATITMDIFTNAMAKVKVKKPSILYDDISFKTIQDGQCIEILHLGSYDDEPQSFQKMDAFTKECGYHRCSSWHREIYLTNANRVLKSKTKTILRYRIA